MNSQLNDCPLCRSPVYSEPSLNNMLQDFITYCILPSLPGDMNYLLRQYYHEYWESVRSVKREDLIIDKVYDVQDGKFVWNLAIFKMSKVK